MYFTVVTAQTKIAPIVPSALKNIMVVKCYLLQSTPFIADIVWTTKLVSIIVGIFFSQIPVIYFRWGLAAASILLGCQ